MQYTDTVYTSHTPRSHWYHLKPQKHSCAVVFTAQFVRWNPLLCQSLAVAPGNNSPWSKPIGLSPFPKRQGRGVLTTWVAPNEGVSVWCSACDGSVDGWKHVVPENGVNWGCVVVSLHFSHKNHHVYCILQVLEQKRKLRHPSHLVTSNWFLRGCLL